MTQSRRDSLKEAITNTGIAFCISLLIQWLLQLFWFDYLGYQAGFICATTFTGVHTIISVARNYHIRRHFNSKLHKH